jgi:hypothetical protein
MHSMQNLTHLAIIVYMAPFNGITHVIYHHNMKVAMDKRKARKARLDNNSHLVEPPWVNKPMPYSMPILWVLGS